MRKRFVVPIIFVLALLLSPSLAAAQSASPGSTTTIQYMPVIQNFSDLTASTSYTLVMTTGASNTTIATFTSDSDGDASVTIDTFDDFGQNVYVLRLTGGADVLSFSVNNMNVIPYFVVAIVFSMIASLMAFFKGAFKFKR